MKLQEAGAPDKSDCCTIKSWANKGQESTVLKPFPAILKDGKGGVSYGPIGAPVLVLSKAPMSRAAARIRHIRFVVSFR